MTTLKCLCVVKKLSFFLVVFVLSSSVFSTNIYAQTVSPTKTERVSPSSAPVIPISLTVSPVSINLVANPGESVTSQIKVKNNNTAVEYLHLSVLKFTSSTSGAPVIADLGPGDEFGQWVSFSEPDITLEANQEKTVKFKIDVPKEAALGYYYAIKIQRIRNVEAGERQTSVEGAPAIPVLLEVRSPNAKRELSITNFTTDSPFYEYLPVQFKVTVKNGGNIHSIPVGDIFIDSSLFGIGQGQKGVAALSFNEGRGNILPRTNRDYFVSWNDAFIVRVPKGTTGKEANEYTLKWDLEKGNKIRIGKYTAHLLMVYDNGQRDIPIEATVSFWVLPWKYMLGALVILLLAFIGLKDTFTKFVKRIMKMFGGR